MTHRLIVAALLSLSHIDGMHALVIADSAMAEPSARDLPEVENELRELRSLATDLRRRITAMEKTVADLRRHRDPDFRDEPKVPEGDPQASPKALRDSLPVDPSTPPMLLDGFCPVELTNNNRWVRGDPVYGAIHRGCVFLFKDRAAQSAFLANPDKYSPKLDGNDPVSLVDEGINVLGRREHGIFFGMDIYLFANEENLGTFCTDPKRYIQRATELTVKPESSNDPDTVGHPEALRTFRVEPDPVETPEENNHVIKRRKLGCRHRAR